MVDAVNSQGEQIGVEVRRRRHQRGWTLDAAAARLGVSRRLLAQLEGGQANPSLSTLLTIAAGFDISLVELLAGGDKPSITVQPDNATATVLWTGPHGGRPDSSWVPIHSNSGTGRWPRRRTRFGRAPAERTRGAVRHGRGRDVVYRIGGPGRGQARPVGAVPCR